MMTDHLGNLFPGIARSIGKLDLATLPTPLVERRVTTATGRRSILIKDDASTSTLYGGNKVRKLEYILHRAIQKGAGRVATFGAAGSNHALATATHAHALGLPCTCFLAHQKKTPRVPNTLSRHVELGTEVVRYGHDVNNLEVLRRHAQHRRTWMIPLGGTCWYGALGFVNAALEFAEQLQAQRQAVPQRIYLANGTMGSAAGLALGLALAGLDTELHAVRVANNAFSNREALQRIVNKTATLMRRADSGVPADLASQTRIVWRGDFFAGGYARVDDPTRAAVATAREDLGLTLETTYTGKAMAALLHDLSNTDEQLMFWNTYFADPDSNKQAHFSEQLPASFARYFE